MKEERENYDDEDIVGAVNRFKRSLISGSTKYFDVEEFEGIVEQLIDEGDFEGSEIAARQGIQIHPNAVPLQLKYAQVLINNGKHKKSLEFIRLAEKLDATNPDVHLLKGTVRLVLGNPTEALFAFKKAMKYAGNEIDEILYNISSAYVQTGNILTAIYYLEKVIRKNPGHEMALYDLGFFYDQLGKNKKSIKYYNKYLDLDPFNYAVWFNLGTVYSKSDKYKKAINAYEYALALNDDFYMALFNIGNTLANAEKFEEAIVKYKEFLEIEPDNDNAYCYIGECYLNLEEQEKSEFYYRKALHLNQKNHSAWFGIGLLFWIGQNFQESISYIKNAIKNDNRNSEYWLTLGKVYADNENREEAMKALKQAARFEAGNTDIWLTWVELYVKYGEQNNAIRILKSGLKNNTDPLLKYRMVAFLLEAKNEKDAFELLQVALEEESAHIDYLFDIYPESLKNSNLKKIVDDFMENNKLR